MTRPAVTPQHHLRRIRIWIIIFIVCLALSGITAFPLATEVPLLADLLHRLPGGLVPDALAAWIDRVRGGIEAVDRDHPFLAYGTDWLAFAHLVIALAFWGPYRDPVRNIWVVEWAMLACVAVIPLALIAGPVRGIPFWWQLIDMSFGVFGLVPLLVLRRRIQALDRAPAAVTEEAAVSGKASLPRPA